MELGQDLNSNNEEVLRETSKKIDQTGQDVVTVTYKKRDDEMYDRNKGDFIVAPAKMSLELPQAKSYDVGDLFGKNESLNMTYSRVQGKKASMDDLLQEILKKNNEQAVLSDKIEERSKEAAELDKEVSKLEYRAKMNGSYAGAIATVGKALKELGCGAAILGFFGPLGAAGGIVAKIGDVISAILGDDNNRTNPESVVHCALEWLTGSPQSRAANKKLEADKIKAEVQSMRDEQSRISTEISVDQSRFSILSQSYSVFISIMQTIISAFNDAKRAITANMR